MGPLFCPYPPPHFSPVSQPLPLIEARPTLRHSVQVQMDLRPEVTLCWDYFRNCPWQAQVPVLPGPNIHVGHQGPAALSVPSSLCSPKCITPPSTFSNQAAGSQPSTKCSAPSSPSSLECRMGDQPVFLQLKVSHPLPSFPHATSQTLLAKFKQQHEDNRYFLGTPVMEPAFIIQHFAGKVKYQIKVCRCQSPSVKSLCAWEVGSGMAWVSWRPLPSGICSVPLFLCFFFFFFFSFLFFFFLFFKLLG